MVVGSPRLLPVTPRSLSLAQVEESASLSLLLKADPLVTSLSLYDIRGAPGVAADVSHIDTPGEVDVPVSIAPGSY